MNKIIELNILLSKEDWFFLLSTLDNIILESIDIEEKNINYDQYLRIYNVIITQLIVRDYLKKK